ncbi:MAG: NADP-dependent oxidoreductase [Thermoplasmata archaeon]|nr:NADP-dependent oxidoreductase [Thermoplasmata archaeon]MCI4341285.1 NADP-dependent oxidoreductase [Thermoplasmata archaeon]
MKAIAVTKFGAEPELMELPKPTPGAGEILVHLAAAGVNPFDMKIANGVLDGAMPHVFPLILGVDGAGVVEAVGPGVTRFAVDDSVYGQFLHSPVGIGTYAEYAVAPQGLALAPRPRGMYSDQAAAVPTAGMTALFAMDQLNLSKGQSLLIIGAAGGVGSFAVQIGSNAGVLTLAVARPDHRDFLHKMGASRFLDSTLNSLHDDVRIAYPNGVDGLLDLAQEGAAFEATTALVRPGGVVASTRGAVTDALLVPRQLRGINVNLTPKVEFLERLSAMFSSGQLRIPLERKIALAAVPDELPRLRGSRGRGKVAITI